MEKDKEMRKKVIVAALVIAAICYVLFVSAKCDSKTGYENIHEQMQLERLITSGKVRG